MKDLLFLDTEFTGLHKDTTLISLALVDKQNRYFYAEFTDYDKYQVDKWIKNNVIKHLLLDDKTATEDKHYYEKLFNGKNFYSIKVKGNTNQIKHELIKWLKQYNEIEIWSDCLSYDWVLFNNIFGSAFAIPENIYYIPFDICTYFKLKNIDPDITREEFIDHRIKGKKHNCLYDAKMIKACYEKLLTF